MKYLKNNIFPILFLCGLLSLLVLISLPVATYAPWAGEDGVIENFQFLLLFLCAYFSVNIFILRRRSMSRTDVLLLLFAAFFFLAAGDEISWGQRILGLRPVLFDNELNNQREWTLHNLNYIESWLYIAIYGFIFLFSCVLPVLTYIFAPVKKLCLRVGIPLMHPVVCLCFWLSTIAAVIVPLRQYGPIGLTGTINQLKQLRELIFDLSLFAYFFADYVSLVRPTGMDARDRGFWASAWEDVLLVVRNNKTVIVLLIILPIVLVPLSKLWRPYRIYLDQKIFYDDPDLTVIEGENISAANDNYWLNDEKGCFGNKYLALYTSKLPPTGYLYFQYTIPVKKAGDYSLVLAGVPAGSDKEGNDTYFCPFKVLLDQKLIKEFNEESNTKSLMEETGSWFYTNYEYTPNMRITKLGQFHLAAGDHELEFRINRRPVGDSEYKFYADAIFLVPKGWKLPQKPFSLAEDLITH